MRRRQGRAAPDRGCVPDRETMERRNSNGEPAGKPDTGETGGGVPSTDARERMFSWFDVVRAGAQLTLDVLRVIREASDLFRKLSGGKGAA